MESNCEFAWLLVNRECSGRRAGRVPMNRCVARNEKWRRPVAKPGCGSMGMAKDKGLACDAKTASESSFHLAIQSPSQFRCNIPRLRFRML